MRAAHVLVTLLLAFLAQDALSQRCREERYLPTDLSIFPTLAATGEIHLHGRYRTNLSVSSEVAFTVTQRSYFRAYLSPEVIDIDLYLYKGAGRVQVASSTSWYREELIAIELSAESYVLEVRPIGASAIPPGCAAVTLELALAPADRTTTRLASWGCPPAPLLPTAFNYQPYLAAGQPFLYDTALDPAGAKFNVRPVGNITGNEFLYGYPFELVPRPGTSPIFHLQATLGYDFLTGGSIRLLLAPTNPTGSPPRCFLADAACKYAVNLVSNEHVLDTTLSPGNYTLWLYDANRRLPLGPCNPVSLRVLLEQAPTEENALSCTAARLPATFNDPGYMDSAGFLHFREHVFLDLSVREVAVRFQANASALFRAWTEAHRVDIDLELVEAGSGQVVARSVRPQGREESLLFSLQASREYVLRVRYYGTYDVVFCEAFLLEVLIQPRAALRPSSCDGDPREVPDLAHVLENVFWPLTIEPHTYRYAIGALPDRAGELIRQKLTVRREMRLRVRVEAQFLHGLDLQLEGNGSAPVRSTSERNGLYLDAAVFPQVDYWLVLRAGPHQESSVGAGLDAFPRCGLYAFDLKLLWFTNRNATTCEPLQGLPSALTSPRYLGETDRLHLRRRVLIPQRQTGFFASEQLTFAVRVPSLFRAYAEEHKVDLDFLMTEDGHPLPHDILALGPEHFALRAEPGRNYTFTVNYYYNFANLERCSSWNLELAIIPIDALGPTAPCAPEALPPNPLFTGSRSSFELSGHYAFTQTATALALALPFTVSDYSHLRVTAAFDFAWGNLVLALARNDSAPFTGENRFNRNELGPLPLSPGTYVLEIREPLPQLPALRRCNSFSLHIILAPANTPGPRAGRDYVPCQLPLPAASFDTVAYRSALSGGALHWAHVVKMDVGRRRQHTTFTVAEASYLRVLVPPHPVDIDVELDAIDEDDRRSTIARSLGYEEETIFVPLPPGRYDLRFRFLPNHRFRIPFPDPDACVGFSLEVALMPVALVDTYLKLGDAACQQSPLPSTVEMDKHVSLNLARHTTPGQPWRHELTFTLIQPALLRAEVAVAFVPGGVYFTLEAENVDSPYLSQPRNSSTPSLVGVDAAFLDRLLWPGHYRLVFEDPANYTVATCQALHLSYYIAVGRVPPNYCDDADAFPTDLITRGGGSEPYGGPQDPDGSVRISGTHFLLPPARTRRPIIFRVVEQSWVRFWLETSARNDVDFLLWQNESKTRLLDSALGSGTTESHLALLPAQNAPYLLELSMYRRVPEECAFASFELAVEPVAAAAARVRCPDPLPASVLPPSGVVLRRGIIYDGLFSDEFYITQEYASGHSQRQGGVTLVTYDMTVQVEGTHVFYATLGFDFALSDFTLSLLRDDELRASASIESAPYSNSFADFEASLAAELTTGTYTLRLTERRYPAHEDRPGDCHRFSLFLFATGQDDTTPRLDAVVPPSGHGLDASRPLQLELRFSQPVSSSLPSLSSALVPWLKAHNAVLLTDSGRPALQPYSASWDPSRTALRVSFADLHFGRTYTLSTNMSAFPSPDGTPFAAYSGRHTYGTLSCDCSGHGVCAPNSTRRSHCLCYYPYAGEECRGCVPGYHRSAKQCVADVRCSSDSCSGHGQCSDAGGVPQCRCDEGYDHSPSAMCAQCHPGYGGYPDCRLLDEDGRPLRCLAPLLPQDLNTAAYLEGTRRGTFHLHDDFHLDAAHQEHAIFFQPERDAYLRAYAEPHHVDIDFWLYQLQPDGRWASVAASYTYNKDESLFAEVQAGRKYKFTLRYLTFGVDVGTCPTFAFDLAMATQDAAREDATRLARLCPALTPPASTLPRVPQPAPVPMEYAPTEVFTHRIDPAQKDQRLPIYSFEVAAAGGAGQRLLLEVDVGSAFLYGPIAVSIARRNGTVVAATGTTAFNVHRLRQYLYNGTYVVTLYLPQAPSPALVPCLPYTLRVTTAYVPLESTLFTCNHAALPTTLNAGSRDASHVHLLDRYLVDERRNSIEFDVRARSVLRVTAGSDTLFSLLLAERTAPGDSWVVQTAADGDGELLWEQIMPGRQYRLEFAYTILGPNEGGADEATRCDVLELQLALETHSDLGALVSPFDCPIGGVAHVPSLPASFSGAPWSSDWEGETFFSFPTAGPIVHEWSFRLDGAAIFTAELAGHFITAPLDLVLVLPRRQVWTRPAHMNLQRLEERLEPGQYTLQLRQPAAPSAELVACGPFEMAVRLRRPPVMPSPCPAPLEPLPTSLDGRGFLGGDLSLEVVADNWAFPPFPAGAWHVEHLINFTVTAPAVLRLYVARHEVDVDASILTRPNLTVVAAAQNLMGEEALVAVLAPGLYVVRLEFWTLTGAVPPCDGFAMQLALEPSATLPRPEMSCPGFQAGRWPQPQTEWAPHELEIPYTYALTGAAADFFYMQTDHGTFGQPIHTWRLGVQGTFDLRAELGFSFLSGSLLLRLKRANAPPTEEAIYGRLAAGGYRLLARALPEGSYDLTLYEAVQNAPSLIGCSHFRFALYLAATAFGETELDALPSLPATLAPLPYLGASAWLHVGGETLLFRNAPFTASTSLVVPATEDILVRAAVSGDDPIEIDLGGGVGRPSRFALIRSPGATATLRLSEMLFRAAVVADLELAVAPLAAVQAAWAAVPACAAAWAPPSVQPHPDGRWHLREPRAPVTRQQLLDGGAIASIPFTLNKTSLLSAQVGYDFLTADCRLELVSADAGGVAAPRHSERRWGLADLETLLLPGRYTLVFLLSGRWNLTTVQPPACAFLDVRISLGPPEGIERGADCSALTLMPWDLSAPSGPMRGGSVSLWMPEVLLPRTATEARSLFTVTRSTVAVLYLSDTARGVMRVSLRPARNGTLGIPVAAQALTSTMAQTAGLWVLSPGEYAYELAYVRTPHACASVGVGLSLQPALSVANDLERVCTDPAYPSQPEQRSLPKELTGAAVQRTGYFTRAELAAATNATTGQVRVVIPFTVSGPSLLDASIAFDPSASHWALALERVPSGSRLATGRFSPFTLGSSLAGLAQQLSLQLQPGTYRLVLEQPPLPPLPEAGDRSQCYPFLFAWQLQADTGENIVRYVEPPSLPRHDPQNDIVLELRFSSAPQVPDGPVTRTERQAALAAAVLLQPQPTTSDPNPQPIPAASASTPPGLPQPDDLTRWTVRFSRTALHLGRVYTLSLGQSLRGANGAEYRLTSKYTYATLTLREVCGDRGTYDEASGSCRCDPESHREGSRCERCEAGYEENVRGACEKRNPCDRPDACSCVGGSPCVPRGQCVPNATAPLHYSCRCGAHFAGDTCEFCAPGWRGAGCAERSDSPVPGPPGSVGGVGLAVGLSVGAVLLIALGAGAWFWWRRRTQVPDPEALGLTLELGARDPFGSDDEGREGRGGDDGMRVTLDSSDDEDGKGGGDDEKESLVSLEPAPSAPLPTSPSPAAPASSLL